MGKILRGFRFSDCLGMSGGDDGCRMAYSADRAYELISSAHERGRLAHAFLISGAHGAGKEHLAARVIQLVSGAKEAAGFDLFGEPVVVETPALDELESGWIRVVRPRMKSRRIGVEEIRNLEQTLHLAAPGGACKVGVITEADRMNDQAANAFLKTWKNRRRTRCFCCSPPIRNACCRRSCRVACGFRC